MPKFRTLRIAATLLAATLLAAPAVAQTEASPVAVSRGGGPWVIIDDADVLQTGGTSGQHFYGPFYAENYRAIVGRVACDTLTGTDENWRISINLSTAGTSESKRTLYTTGDITTCGDNLVYMGGGVVASSDSPGSQFSETTRGDLPHTFYVVFHVRGSAADAAFNGTVILYAIPN